MEAICSYQIQLHNSIRKAWDNYKKSPKDRITVMYIDTRLEILEQNWNSFRNNHTKLYETYDCSDLSENEYIAKEIYDKTEEIYMDYKSKCRFDRSQFKNSSNNDDQSKKDSISSSNSLVKLPKISIPIFSGKYSEWTSFRDLFRSLIDNNKSLDNVQKLHYLKSHLTGEAEQLIRHIEITDANYSECWAKLEGRYNNKVYLVDCVMKRLFGQRRSNIESAIAIKELVDNTSDCLNALTNLGIDISSWDVVIIYITAYKLDPETRKQWELQVADSHILPTWRKFKVFMETRFRALERIEPKRTTNPNQHIKNNNTPAHHNPKALLGTTKSPSMSCEYCSEKHKLCFCKKFIKETYDAKRQFVTKNNICFNCLGSNHTVYDCKKPTNCKVCNKRHHSLLHPQVESGKQQEKDAAGTSSQNTKGPEVTSCLSTGEVTNRQVLLATALVNAQSKNGDLQVIRALIDQGSQACFVTEATVQLLRLQKIPIQGVVSGIGQEGKINTKFMVTLVVHSRVDPQFKMQLKAYVLRSITSYLPEKNLESFIWADLNEIHLADPQYNTPNKIDILLGADVYGQIISEGIKKSPSGAMVAQNTSLGWILSGVIHPETAHKTLKTINTMTVHINHDDFLKRFWEIEEYLPTEKRIFTEEEQSCEEIYSKTTKRSNGRYIVNLPFRDEVPLCRGGNSKEIAVARLKSQERKFAKDQDLKAKYKEVIHEYLELEHMRPVKKEESSKEHAVYLPHHAVVRNDKTTTKVRIVFNASQKNKNGISLNDSLMVGPTLQDDLRDTVLRWRVHPIAIIADITKMYRQIMIAEEDRAYQRIVWRDNPDEEIKEYELLTVTFGTASAPYLAVRTLHQISYDEGENFPLVAEKVLKCFYMDDLMTGCESVEEGLQIYKQITELLQRGGFELQKWNSNNQQILQYIQENATRPEKEKRERQDKKDTQDKDGKEIELKTENTTKTLGLTWNHEEDVFQYAVKFTTTTPTAGPVTKRIITADIARLFDPLGWVAPVIVVAKIFIQKLWLTGLDWDEAISKDLEKEWYAYRNELSEIAKVKIPRWLSTKSSDVVTELHGFSDASKAAYSAVIYLRIQDSKGKVHTSLLTAKTRVAPIKQISIPRLELCGAVLLTRLLVKSAEVLNIQKDNLRAWTDSTVVLAWLNSHPSRWKTFVGNRVSEILTSLNSSQWFHVSTKENPADQASRGVAPSFLVKNKLWFSGPPFLKEHEVPYTKPKNLKVSLEESVKVKAHVTANPATPIMSRFSSLQRLLKVVAYCRRFLRKSHIKTQHLQKLELDEALQCCIRMTQKENFATEYQKLENKETLHSQSKLRTLCPYLDEKDIIRVSGRIQKSELEEGRKHPIIMPKDAHLTKLIIAEAHKKTLHGGTSLMMNYLRSAYWITGMRSIVRSYIHKCVMCARQRANIKDQMMGSLPSVRCNPARPFLNSGVDYAGPINIRTTKGRGHKSHKGYICLFVCMSTRAIHLEVVSDMTSQAFLAAFKRFVSRRGHCSDLWSDNGTTFVGAARELQENIRSTRRNITEHLESSGTEWHFIPPHAPNFGGLWEAGVKSTKFHLKRVIGDSTLTYEELSTLLAQIEACLNSRPISVIDSTDPNEPLPLTPAHFLVGEPLVCVVEPNYEQSNINYLTRWQLTQRMLQTFWKRWSCEYLSTLMQRFKWSKQNPEPNVNDVVLIKEDDLPPSRWLMGRVVEKHPGHDKITRVVTLKTKNMSIIKRPVSKICVLPVNQ